MKAITLMLRAWKFQIQIGLDVVMAALRESLDPLCPCDDYGISSYLSVRDFLVQLQCQLGNSLKDFKYI